MNIFVTGACGFIGSHLVEKLVKNNFNVKALTFYNNRNHYGWLENLDKGDKMFTHIYRLNSGQFLN